jgi:tripartite-type tricarboxylate transporter receptor subunit TctC
VANVLVVNPALPVKTAQELIAYAKKNPGKLNYGSPGYGTSPQLSSELFKSMTDTFIVHIPFSGAGPATAALLGGNIEMMIDNIPPQVGNIKAGKVRALAVTSLKRSPLLPEVPTVDESGVPGYEDITFNGLVAPAGTSHEALVRVQQAVSKAVAASELYERFITRGVELKASASPEEFTAYVKAEYEKKSRLARDAGMKPE